MRRVDGNTTPATPRGGDLGGHGGLVEIAPGELEYLPGGNEAVDVELK